MKERNQVPRMWPPMRDQKEAPLVTKKRLRVNMKKQLLARKNIRRSLKRGTRTEIRIVAEIADMAVRLLKN